MGWNQPSRKAIVRWAASLLIAGWAALPVIASDWDTVLVRPDQEFVFYQFNLAAGYDSAEPDNGGLADRGPRTQLNIEWFAKDKGRIQRGYTRLAEPSQWNLKIGLEVNPAEQEGEDPSLDLRLFDAWVRFDTKWDRTSFWLGHRSIPFGHNPRLDPGLSPLPNQASLDLGFGRDTGVFFKTPVAARLDLDLAVTAGGLLSGPLVSAGDQDGSFEVEDRISYNDTWLVTARLGRPHFERVESGVFAAVGSVQRGQDNSVEVSRLGFDWVVKHREDWHMVHQISGGENDGDGQGKRWVGNLLNSFELFLGPRWRLGLTHSFQMEDLVVASGSRKETGVVFGSVSYALTRNARLRLNPFVEYRDTAGERDTGVNLQLCFGCGWRK